MVVPGPVFEKPERDEVVLVARGLATAVAPDTGLVDVQAALLQALTSALTDIEVDYRDLEPLGAEDLAAALAGRDVAVPAADRPSHGARRARAPPDPGRPSRTASRSTRKRWGSRTTSCGWPAATPRVPTALRGWTSSAAGSSNTSRDAGGTESSPALRAPALEPAKVDPAARGPMGSARRSAARLARTQRVGLLRHAAASRCPARPAAHPSTWPDTTSCTCSPTTARTCG